MSVEVGTNVGDGDAVRVGGTGLAVSVGTGVVVGKAGGVIEAVADAASGSGVAEGAGVTAAHPLAITNKIPAGIIN